MRLIQYFESISRCESPEIYRYFLPTTFTSQFAMPSFAYRFPDQLETETRKTLRIEILAKSALPAKGKLDCSSAGQCAAFRFTKEDTRYGNTPKKSSFLGGSKCRRL